MGQARRRAEAARERTCWLVRDAVIPDDALRHVLEEAEFQPGNGQVVRDQLETARAKNVNMAAIVWLVVMGSKHVWCAFAGASPDRDSPYGFKFTPAGFLTASALMNLPGISPAEATPVLSRIDSPSRFKPVVDGTLAEAPDRSLIIFMGDVAGALDGLEFKHLPPRGMVNAAVELDGAGWPKEWWPLPVKS